MKAFLILLFFIINYQIGANLLKSIINSLQHLTKTNGAARFFLASMSFNF